MGMLNTIEYLKENNDILDKIVETCYNSFNIELEKEIEDLKDEENNRS